MHQWSHAVPQRDTPCGFRGETEPGGRRSRRKTCARHRFKIMPAWYSTRMALRYRPKLIATFFALLQRAHNLPVPRVERHKAIAT